MKYDIYFHNDFDGRASAAVMLAFLRSRGDDIEHFIPVNYEIIPAWLKREFFKNHRLFKGARRPAIVVDFPYHPDAAFWFDHHPTTFKKDAWKKAFRADKFHRYEPRYKSACHLIYASLRDDFGWKPPAHLAELVKWLDIVDGANYHSARQTIAMKEPALQINNFIEGTSDVLPTAIWTVQYLSAHSLRAFAREFKVRNAVAEIRRKTKLMMAFYREHIEQRGGVMVIDLTKAPYRWLAHFAPYYLYPKVLYAVRFNPRNGLFHVNVSANPWRRVGNKKHIGEFLHRYDGGGHKDVGGVEFRTRRDMRQAIEEIVAFLNRPR